MKKSRSIMILLSLLIIMSVSSSVYALATVSGPLSNATGGDINSPASPSASTPTASAAAPAIPAPAQPKPEPPKYHVNDEKIIVAGNGNEIYVNTFTPNPDDKAVLYAVDPENHLYQQQSDKTWRPLSDDEAKALPWANPTNADGTPNPLFNKDLAAQLGENQKYNDWRNTFLEKMDVPWMQAMSIGNTWMEILVQNNVLDDKFLFGDLFKPLLDFYATKWGGVLSGDWENSICRFTTDYENAAGNGFAFTPGTTQPGAWIGSEVYIVRHPDILNPEPENDLVEKFFITTLSVNANGLTADAGEDCVQRVKFYVSMGGKKLDINGDGTYDVVDLKCDDSYSLTGANAIVINSTTYSFSKVCLHFTDISQLAAAFTEQLEGGNEICKSVTSVGESPDIADCGVYCSATGTESEIGGIDLPSIDLGGGAGAEGTEEKPSYKPTPGKSGSPGLV